MSAPITFDSPSPTIAPRTEQVAALLRQAQLAVSRGDWPAAEIFACEASVLAMRTPDALPLLKYAEAIIDEALEQRSWEGHGSGVRWKP